jgi:alpha-mannosidase/mannosylglycerate hydrolase
LNPAIRLNGKEYVMKAFYCAGTHWDREWYEPFQEYRRWLVELIDELIDLMESGPDYPCFHLDGQTVMLEDYLEIRPERREPLLKLLRERRLLAGPWYNLPDEWLISGESFVRNLMRGVRICRNMGFPHLDFAYTPDQFGHIAALPMIMRGFGLSAGICWRGTQDETFPMHFAWVGPDGGKLAYHKLTDKGSYAPFQFAVRDHLRTDGYTDESHAKHFDPYFAEESARTVAPLLLMLDAIDHTRPDHEMPKIFQKLKERRPDIEFCWTSLEEYGRELARHVDTLPERRGELREPCRDHTRVGQYLIVHVISSRYDLKQRNDHSQALLEKWVEPMLVYEAMAGGAPVPGFLDKAWQYLLRNHPHDSICGCSQDQIHRDMHYRFDQCDLIADGCARGSMARIAGAAAGPEDWRRIAVHNPLPRPRRGVFDLSLFFPADHAEKAGKSYIDGLSASERYNKFHLVLPDGTHAPYQHVRVERRQETQQRLDATGRHTFGCGDLYHVAVELELPAAGYTTLRVEPCDAATRTFGSLMTGPLRAANGLIAFELKPDGTGRLTHLADGRVFDGLFCYEDAGECGDGWTRGQPLNDIVYRGPGTAVMTAIDEDGPLRTVFRVERTLALPRELDQKTGYRSTDRVSVRVTDFITIAKHSPILQVRTVVDNCAKDHRLRVLFPTRAQTDTSFADTPFAMVEREIAVPVETAEWQERINPEKAFTSVCGVQDSIGGLAVLCPEGLHEYAVLDTAERTLALTLFRSFRKTVARSEETEGQLQGYLSFSYGLCVFASSFNAALAFGQLAELQTPVRTHDIREDAPATRSFLRVDAGATVMTAIKPAEDGPGAVIRFWNPGTQDGDARFQLDRPVIEASLCNLNEEMLEALPVTQEGAVAVSVPAGGLSTVRFRW